MKDYYGLSDTSYAGLIRQGITVTDLLRAAPLFDPHGCSAQVDKVGILYYIDNKGDFNMPPFFPHKRIARAAWDNLAASDKIAVAEYADFLENNT